MPQFEVYAECAERSAAQARRFLERFVPDRREVASEYPLPELSDTPRDVFVDAASLIERLELERREGYALYWDRKGVGDPHQAVLVFTEDGGMIAGLASAASDSAGLLLELAGVVRARFGVVVLEERPPITLPTFRELCRASPGNRLIDGQFVSDRSQSS